MTDFLSRLATRARNEMPVATPRRHARFERDLPSRLTASIELSPDETAATHEATPDGQPSDATLASRVAEQRAAPSERLVVPSDATSRPATAPSDRVETQGDPRAHGDDLQTRVSDLEAAARRQQARRDFVSPAESRPLSPTPRVASSATVPITTRAVIGTDIRAEDGATEVLSADRSSPVPASRPGTSAPKRRDVTPVDPRPELARVRPRRADPRFDSASTSELETSGTDEPSSARARMVPEPIDSPADVSSLEPSIPTATAMPSRRADVAKVVEPTITIKIGRVDVRAERPSAPAPRQRTRPPRGPNLALGDYLSARSARRR
ncbi:MAG: hypothetical protein AAGD38_10745 [Acidobacteriota bacterium]